MPVHQICLNAAWEIVLPAGVLPAGVLPAGVLSADDAIQRTGKRLHLPCDASAIARTLKSDPGSVCIARNFNSPTGIVPSTRVSLLFVVDRSNLSAMLNECPLKPSPVDVVELVSTPFGPVSNGSAFRITVEIGHLLRPFNRLKAELTASGSDSRPARIYSVFLQMEDL